VLDHENYVERFRTVIEGLVKQDGNLMTSQALSNVLDIPISGKGDYGPREFLMRLADLQSLASKAKAQVAELDDHSAEVYTRVIGSFVEAVRAMDLSAHWNHHKDRFDVRSRAHLETCSLAVQRDLQSRPTKTPATTEDDLKSLREAVEVTRTEVLAAEIEPEAQELLLDIVHELKRALDAYSILGLNGLRRAVERYSGALIIHNQRLAAAEKQAPGLMRRVIDTGLKAVGLLRSIEFVAELPEKAMKLLEAMLD
jgi:hypothetical protein